MDEKKAKTIADYIFKDIFGKENPFSLEEIKRRFAYDIKLPEKTKDSISGGEIWAVDAEEHKVIGSLTMEEQAKRDGWMRPKQKIRDLDDAFKYWNNVAYFPSERIVDSNDLAKVDHIYGCSSIYDSAKIESSSKVLFSNHILNGKYLAACYYTYDSQTTIRGMESEYCTSSFACTWASKVSRCMYVSSGLDLYECILCSNLIGKKYCIANMQFTKEEYMPIKKQLIDWTIENFKKGNTLGF